MPTRTRRRLLLGLGWIGLLLAFFPFYHSSKSPRPAGQPEQPNLEVPFLGELPAESSRTRFTIGLPFSPLFLYEQNVVVETTWSDKPSGGSTIQVTGPDGQKAPQETVKSFSTSSKMSYSWAMSILSWSAAIAVVSMALLVLARRSRRLDQATANPIDPESPSSILGT